MKYAFIIRGIPGSGKSTLSRIFIESFPGKTIIHSTDDLCMVDGEYQWDIDLAPERHAQNLENFRNSLKSRVPSIIVDNTNVRVEHYAPYVEAAQAAGYAVVIVELIHPALDEAVERNTHGVPVAVINQMILDWEPAQHCVTVAAVNEAAAVVEMLQGQTRGFMAVAFGVGAAIGAVIVALAWLISP